MHGFWGKLKETLPAGRQAFLIMAPMANVTDAAFRRMFAKYGKADVTYTEFVSADGLALAPEEGRAKLLRDLAFTEGERPIVAQFFTSNPGHMEKAAALAQELGFDGVDINMGCPDKAVEKQGAGSALIKTPQRAKELIRAAKRGAPNLPISVKTRLGYNKDTLDEWLPQILEEEPAHVTIHARTRKEMSLVPARWDRVKRAVEIRNEMGSKTLISGNGDVWDIADAYKKAEETGADGVMIGRGIFGKPWMFAAKQKTEEKNGLARDGAEPIRETRGPFSQQFSAEPTPLEETFPSLEERLRIAVEHTKLFEELLGDIKNFAIMKKHFKAYVEGFDGAKELRVQLMEAKNAAEVETIITDFIAQK